MSDALNRYLAVGEITVAQHAAATRFGENVRAAVNYRRRRRANPLSRAADPAERAAAAHVSVLCDRLGEHHRVLVAVCARGRGATTWAQENGLHPAAGLPRLRAALDALVQAERDLQRPGAGAGVRP